MSSRIRPAPAGSVGACILSLLSSVALHAQQPARDTVPVVLETLEVTTTRERAAPPPVATVDLTGRVLEHTQSANPYDLFRRAAAVEVHEQGQGPGFASDVVVRGFTSDHSGDVLLVVDGVPVNLPINGHGEGYADWNSLLPAAISSLRLIDGTASPLYGDFALAGAVEVFTRADADGTSLALTGSSQGGVGGWLRTGRRSDTGGSMLAVEGRWDDGWRPQSGYALGNLLLRGWQRVGASGRLEGGLGLYRTGWDSPGFVSVAQFNAGQFDYAADRTDGGSATRVVGHARYAVPLGGHTALEAVGWGFASWWRLFLNVPEGNGPVGQTAERDQRNALGGQATLTWTPPAGEFTLGISGRADQADYFKGESDRRVVETIEEEVAGGYHSGSTFGRWRRTFGGRLGLDLGLRLDALHYRSTDERTGAAPLSDTHVLLAPKAGARYLLGGNAALLASFSRGFKGAAGVLTDPARPLLSAWSSEVGVEWAPDPLELHLALFRMDVSHERIVDPITQAITSAGSSVRQGVDLRGTLLVGGATRVTFGATWNDANLTGEFADAHLPAVRALVAGDDPLLYPGPPAFHEESGSGKRVPGVAQYVAQLGVTRVVGTVPLGLNARVLGPYVPIGEPDIETQAYLVADVTAGIPLTTGVSADVSLQNLFNRRYAEIRASGFINPGVPRTLRVNLNWTLGSH